MSCPMGTLNTQIGNNYFGGCSLHTPCAIDKIPDFSVLGQAILMVDRLFLGQESNLKSCHWKNWCGDFRFVLAAKFGSSLEN